MERKFYSIDETAKKIGVHPKTIRRYIFSGKLEGLKVGGQWRIYQDAIETFLSLGSDDKEKDTNQHLSKDDFCVFMDSGFFKSDKKIQICTIIDYYAQNKKDVLPVAKALMEELHNCDEVSGDSRLNYVYDDADKKARFVFWGTPYVVEKMAGALKRFEETLGE